MKEWVALAGGETVASNQILYNLSRRGPEWELIPWCRERRISIMAYSPLEQGRMLGNRGLQQVAPGIRRPRRRSRLPGCCGRTA